MASGIDGPGNLRDKTDDTLTPKLETRVDLFVDSPVPIAASTPNVQPDIPGNDEALEKRPPQEIERGDSHLSFAGLMQRQHNNPEEPASDARRMNAYDVGYERGRQGYHPTPQEDISLNEEMEKVFQDKPYRLEMDFSRPAAPSEVQTYPDQKYSETDYSSRRRSQVNMYQPMKTHLSSHELSAIQSAHGSSIPGAPDSTKRRRHRSSSSSSGSHGSSKVTTKPNVPDEKRQRKKNKKQKKNKRKSLTAKVRHRTLSIPEEDEEQSESEDSEEEEDELVGEEKIQERKDDDADDSEGGRPIRDSDVGDDATMDKQRKNQSPPVDKRSGKDGECNDEVGLVEDFPTNVTIDKDSVLFTLGAEDGLKPSGAPVTPPADDASTKSLPRSRSSSTSSSSSSESETETQSEVQEISVPESSKTAAESHKKRHKRHHNHHHKHKRRHKHEDALQRRMSGNKVKEMDSFKVPKIVIGDDDEDLGGAAMDEIKSHRLEDQPGIRKHLLHRPVKKRRVREEVKKKYDNNPHEVFVELDELVSGEWKETARWIKFEEDVEESQMWGKPRVASLSFHSLLELRKTIEKGAVMLDMDRDNLTDVANDVVAGMVETGQIRAEDQGNVLKVLLSKHKHLAPQTTFPYNLSQASFSSFFNPSYGSKLNTAGHSGETLDVSEPLIRSHSDMEKGIHSSASHGGNISNIPSGPSAKELKIMKKIPEGAEATAVLVGCVEYLEQPTMAFVRLAQGTKLENVVSLPIPVRFIFVLLGPSRIDYNYHEIGRSISTLMADEEFHVMAYGAESRVDLLRAINEFLDDSIVLPPGQMENPDLLRNIIRYQKGLAQREKKKKQITDEKKEPPPPDEDPLKRSGRPFGGFIKDVKNRYPKYLSDITDAINLQCLASIIFIYFAALSPAITFGGLLGEKTDGWMGVSEMILGCCVCGCMFGLISGQPLLVVGSTGPLLVFEEAVYNFCMSNGLPFLATRVWIGVWIFVISFVTVAFEGSFLVRFVSRFTQEIFTALISLIFIYETFNKLGKTFQQHPLQAFYPYPINTSGILSEYNCSYVESINITNATIGNITDAVQDAEIRNQPNTALLSTLLMFGTFIIAYFLRQFKNSKFLRSSVRRTIGDFGVPIAIFAMVLLDVLVQDTYTQKLNVPKGISPTNPSLRGWFINPLGTPDNPMPVWMIFAGILPAFLVFILIFMESHITEMIISNKERNLKKGTGFHLNLMVLGMLNVLVSFFGMPWVCCAAVRSITHTNSLTVMSKTQAPGDKPKIEGTKEQRVTVFVVNACLGLSILMQPVLSEIPLAVLFGIFLYMGVTSLTGVQFIDRIEMLFMPSKHYPDFSYVEVVRHMKIHIFTLIQIICLAILWIVKSTAAQIAFPFFLVMTIPLRYFVLPKFFTPKEIAELDSSETKTSVTNRNMDEYNDANMPE
ncbi:band 3 anion transport protein isoform X2 [Ciona intestinalis]